MIIWDSQAQGIASAIKCNLEEDFEIQSIIKPRSEMAAIMNKVTRDTGALTNHDVVVVWEWHKRYQ